VLNFDDSVFVSRVLIEGVKYYASEPRMLGRTFLRLVSELLCDKEVFCHIHGYQDLFLCLDSKSCREALKFSFLET